MFPVVYIYKNVLFSLDYNLFYFVRIPYYINAWGKGIEVVADEAAIEVVDGRGR